MRLLHWLEYMPIDKTGKARPADFGLFTIIYRPISRKPLSNRHADLTAITRVLVDELPRREPVEYVENASETSSTEY